jgi:hypothetical protein
MIVYKDYTFTTELPSDVINIYYIVQSIFYRVHFLGGKINSNMSASHWTNNHIILYVLED